MEMLFREDEVIPIYDLKDYNALRCKNICFIDSEAHRNPSHQPGTKCRRYSSLNIMMSLLWARKIEHLGEENPEDTILLLDYITGASGLMDIIKFTYDYVHIAEERGWVPVVKIDRLPNQYLQKPGDNVWDYFFRPVSRISVESAMHSAHVIRASTNSIRMNHWIENPYHFKYMFY